MNDQSSYADFEHEAKCEKARREVFLGEMDQVLPWPEQEAVIEPFYPKPGERHQPCSLGNGLRFPPVQMHDLSSPMLERVSRLAVDKGLMLKCGTIVDATIVDAPG